jgi:thiamine-phosphate pyrophosphorylase
VSLPPLHILVGDEQAVRPDFPEVADELLDAWGADLALHLRLRQAAGARLFELASRFTAAAERTGGWCVVNDRLDVALGAGAQAVQLGRTALPVAAAREVIETCAGKGGPLPTGPALGASVHGEEEARSAAADGANYLVLGTIFASRTHPGVTPHGIAIVERCCAVGLPVIAIGGMNAARAPEVRRAGAAGLAVVRAVWDAGEPREAAGRLIRAWKERPVQAANPEVE